MVRFLLVNMNLVFIHPRFEDELKSVFKNNGISNRNAFYIDNLIDA